MPRETNPRELSDRAVSLLVTEGRCPMCLGTLDSGLVCNCCGYDAQPWVKISRERNERAHDNRERVNALEQDPNIFTPTTLQYAETGKGPWKLYIYDRDGYHSGGKWFRSGPMKYPDEEISGAEALRLCQEAQKNVQEVKVCDGGDMLVFHAIGKHVMYGADFWKR